MHICELHTATPHVIEFSSVRWDARRSHKIASARNSLHINWNPVTSSYFLLHGRNLKKITHFLQHRCAQQCVFIAWTTVSPVIVIIGSIACPHLLPLSAKLKCIFLTSKRLDPSDGEENTSAALAFCVGIHQLIPHWE